MFCRETVADLRQVAQHTPNYPPILFVYHGSVEDGEDFFGALWPEARAVADPNKTLYTAFGIGRAGLRQIMSPEVAACAVRATAKGHLGGRPQGDTLTLPDLFLVHRDRVLWQFRARHVADHPDWQRLVDHLPADVKLRP